MDKQERIVLGVFALVLVALVVAKYRTAATPINDIQPVTEAADGNQSIGPDYLVGSQTWAYMPWVGSVLPQVTAGQGNQSPGFTPNRIGDGAI